MDLGNGLGHLTYSTLVHPGDTWEEMWASLTTYVPKIKARIAPNEAFGVSLRLSAASAQTLVRDLDARDKLKKFLADNDLYLHTVNAFPYGPFKGRIVKEQVYEPDWRSEERTEYTINVAEVLADVAPEGTSPSIQSAPLGFKPRVTGPDVVSSFTEHVLRVAAHLVELAARTGRTVGLALEPEPFCFLETTDEAVEYFTEHLYSGAAAETLAKSAGIPISEAHVTLRSHLGIVFDICHQAVEYEDISVSLQKLVDAGIPIFKLQRRQQYTFPWSPRKSLTHLLATPRPSISLRRSRKEMAALHGFSTSKKLSPRGIRIRARGNGAPTFTFRSSWMTSARSARHALPSRMPSNSTRRIHCLVSSRSKPIRGMCCRGT